MAVVSLPFVALALAAAAAPTFDASALFDTDTSLWPEGRSGWLFFATLQAAQIRQRLLQQLQRLNRQEKPAAAALSSMSKPVPSHGPEPELEPEQEPEPRPELGPELEPEPEQVSQTAEQLAEQQAAMARAMASAMAELSLGRTELQC